MDVEPEYPRKPMAAGHVVVAVLVALVLAAFLNARGMRKSAEIREILPRATEEAVHRDYFVLA